MLKKANGPCLLLIHPCRRTRPRLRQAALQAESRGIDSIRRYQTRLDRFKITLGVPVDDKLILDDRELARLRIDDPDITREEAVQIADRFQVEDLNFSNGISGWWACGYIEAHPKAKVLMEDTRQRPLVVIDTESPPGTIILTASGPLGDGSYATTDDSGPNRAMVDLYHALIDYISLPQPATAL